MIKPLRYGLLGVAGCLLALEILLQCLPVSSATNTGYYLNPLILTYPPRHAWTSSTGWDLRNAQHLVSNNVGFLAHRDFVLDTNAVALIGDSYVEAAMLDPADRPDNQLERALGGRAVYAMGGPGTSLLDYAERVEFAKRRYGTRDFVLLLETGDLRQSLCGSGNINGPCLDPQTFEAKTETGQPPGTLKRFARHSALAQYLVGHLMLSPQRLWQQAVAQARPAQTSVSRQSTHRVEQKMGDALSAGERSVALAFLLRIKPFVGNSRVILVLDCDRKQIYAGHADRAQKLSEFADLARGAGLYVVQLAPTFAENYAANSLSFDVGPYDGHFNKLGVKLLSAAAARALQN